MGIKHTQEYIDNYFLLNGWTNKSNYVNADIKLNVTCNNGHSIEINFNKFQQGGRCPICLNCKPLTYEYANEYISKYNYKMISSIFITSRDKIIIQCDKGHIYKARFSCFKQGQRCQQCYRDRNKGANHYLWIEDRTRQSRSKLLCIDLRLNKTIKTIKLLKNYKIYITNKTMYNIDHIFPRIAFIDNNFDRLYDLTIIKKICNSHDNLQILSKKDNISKNSKYNQEEFINWFTNKLILNLMNI